MTPADPRVILPFLKRLLLRHHLQTYSGLFGGIILSLLGPLLVTVFFLIFSLSLILDHGFWGAYRIIAAVTLPIFFFIAWRLRGSVLENAAPDGDSLSGRWMQRKVAPVLVIAELANIGPRLVLWAIERIIGQSRVRGMGLGRIAQCVSELTKQSEGVSPATLLFPGESPRQLEPMLAFLLYHGIADLSKRGDRVWITTLFRQQLIAASEKTRQG